MYIKHWPDMIPDTPEASSETDFAPVYAAVARYFALLADPTRLRIVHALCQEERSVNEIVQSTGGTQTNISRHLGLMHERGALVRRREGSQVFYRLGDPTLMEMCRSVCQRVSSELDGVRDLREGLDQMASHLR
ncbi:metalloregulator ArsR/SmtB family transcription factor [uncultured Sphaerotilus sp.]|uniref:ArsR/SmtB family transcription factor n=1 Tax=uncultured Sphaerotilus sp. TaxID=474984 RepID=UPI0030CA50F6